MGLENIEYLLIFSTPPKINNLNDTICVKGTTYKMCSKMAALMRMSLENMSLGLFAGLSQHGLATFSSVPCVLAVKVRQTPASLAYTMLPLVVG